MGLVRCGHGPLGDATLHRNVTSDRQARRDKTEAGEEHKRGVASQKRAGFHFRAFLSDAGSSVGLTKDCASGVPRSGAAASLDNSWLTKCSIACLPVQRGCGRTLDGPSAAADAEEVRDDDDECDQE